MFDRWLSKKKEAGNKSPELESVEELLRDLDTVEIKGIKYKLSWHQREGLTGSSYDMTRVSKEVFGYQEEKDPDDPRIFSPHWENSNGITREDLEDAQEKYDKINKVLAYLVEKGLVHEEQGKYQGQFAEKAEILHEKRVLLESLLETARDLGI